jgi:hypothetical protein
MPRQSTKRADTSLLRTITRPFSSALAYVMRATGRTYNETHYSGAGGGVGTADESSRTPRRKQRQGRRHGRRR